MAAEIQKIQIATANKMLREKKISGSISTIDRENNLVLFLPAGVSFITKNVIAVPLDDKLLEAEDSAYPEDWLLHFAVYRHYPQAGSVGLIHPMYGSAYANAEKDVPVYDEKYASVFPGGIRCLHLDRSKRPWRLLAEVIDRSFEGVSNASCSDQFGALLVSHKGELVWDSTPQKTYERALKAAGCAKAAFFASRAGDMEPMSPDLAQYYSNKKNEEGKSTCLGIPGSPVTKEQRKRITLELLEYFDRVCRENGVHYSITGGTLLGAVRHGGFVPWDDDVDVFMTRPEYEKVREIMPDDERFVLVDARKKPDYNFVYGRLIDTKTMITESPGTLNAGNGVFLDICIVDGLPNNALLRKLHIKHMYLLTRLRLAARKGVSIREPSVRTYRKHGRIKSRVYLLMSRILRKFTSHHYWNHRMEKVMALYPVENAQYVGNFTSQYGEKEMLEKSVFDSYIDMQFEGLTVMACKQYEKYLISIYGDYTKLPALKKRKGHHPGNIYWQ